MKTSETVLIAGGSGLIGRPLSKMMADAGYGVRILTRKKKQNISFEQAEWNPEKNFLEAGALNGIDYIINLSGTGIADKPWTEKRKKDIIESRIKPIETLVHHLKNHEHKIKAFISASAIGIYPKNKTQVMTEESLPGNDFLSCSVMQWENALLKTSLPQSIRKVIMRFGIVLSLKGGALPEILTPFRFHLAVILGNGKQIMSWVHIDDVCRALMHAVRHTTVSGIYNVTAPEPVTFKALIDETVKTKNRWFPKTSVPAFVLKLMMGERAGLVLDSIRVSSARLESTGFQFLFPSISSALKNLFYEKQP